MVKHCKALTRFYDFSAGYEQDDTKFVVVQSFAICVTADGTKPKVANCVPVCG